MIAPSLKIDGDCRMLALHDNDQKLKLAATEHGRNTDSYMIRVSAESSRTMNVNTL